MSNEQNTYASPAREETSEKRNVRKMHCLGVGNHLSLEERGGEASGSLLYLSLGSNLGNRHENIRRAVRLLEERVGKVCAMSSFFQTEPVGFASENLFINVALSLRTKLQAGEILARTQQIERELGRTAKSVDGHYTDRTIDIDLLHMEGVQLQTSALTLPHPRLAERRFVLEPLAQIAPSLFLPTLKKTVSVLLQQLNQGKIEILSPESLSAETLSRLNSLLRQLSATARPLSMDSLQNVAEDRSVRVYVLRDEAGVIQATLTLTFVHQLTGLKAWVEDVVVDSSCRHRGYARQLLRFVEKEAACLGIAALNLTSRPQREAANHLYQSEGYEKRETNVYKKGVS